MVANTEYMEQRFLCPHWSALSKGQQPDFAVTENSGLEAHLCQWSICSLQLWHCSDNSRDLVQTCLIFLWNIMEGASQKTLTAETWWRQPGLIRHLITLKRFTDRNLSDTIAENNKDFLVAQQPQHTTTKAPYRTINWIPPWSYLNNTVISSLLNSSVTDHWWTYCHCWTIVTYRNAHGKWILSLNA